jgi:hypothetical protein
MSNSRNDANPLQLLTELLAGYATPVIKPDRLAPSATYDLDYRISLIAFSFELHAKPYTQGKRWIGTAKLKLLQFVAQRPWLLPVIRQWGNSQKDSEMSLLSPQHLRRGYVGDKMFNDVLDYLVARGYFVRNESHLIETDQDLSRRMYRNAVENCLFESERSALAEFNTVKLTNLMLEGS